MCRSFCFLLCVCVCPTTTPPKNQLTALLSEPKPNTEGGRKTACEREREQERQRESLGVCFSEGWMILLGLLLGI